ncbi:hypothetical protein [Dethiosulfovibrio salsuginis]|uniref:Uncharacterized protein n=1 Tax=Dethiosulfovibrio salsuginis TaxID=561720 RepID=A0A1X7KIF4_9BACT|nr:hypothetical protein [Dethiosulfovibrio salsuginis]SMG40855.1 hypothetical protein SAMN06275492_12833 [Dethiosulfovibrio salsuginis]
MNGTWGHRKPKEIEDICFIPYQMKKESARRGEANRLRLAEERKVSSCENSQEKPHHPARS